MRVWGLLIITIGLYSCSSPGSSYKDSKITSLADPIELKYDTTYVLLDSLFDQAVELDSSYSDGPFEIISVSDNMLAIIKSSPTTKPIYQLSLVVDEIPYAVPLRVGNASMLELKWEESGKYRITAFADQSDGLYAFWENFALESNRQKSGEYKVAIPSFASFEKRSHLRLVAYNDSAVSSIQLIPLRKAKPDIE